MAGEVAYQPSNAGWLYQPDFPSPWERVRLHDLATWINGLAFRDINFSASGRPVIKIAEVKNGISGQTKFTDAGYGQAYLVNPGDMLFCWSGQPETSIDVYWWRGPTGWLNQHVFKVLPDSKRVLPKFLYYILKYLNPNFVSIASNKQTTGLGHVTKNDLQRMEVALPNLNDQRAIAHILGTLDDRIELNRRMNETLEAMARGIFKSWFVDFDPVRAKLALSGAEGAEGRDTGLPPHVADLFPNRLEESELGEIPAGWKATVLKALVVIHDSKRIPLSDRERAERKGIYPYYGAASVMDYVDDFLFEGTYVLLGEDGSVVNPDDSPVVQYAWGKFWVNNHAHVLTGAEGIPIEYLVLLLKQTKIRPFVTGAVQPKLTQGNLTKIPCLLPAAGVIAAFAKQSGGLFAEIRANADQSSTLAALRDALLPKLLSGEIRVHDAEQFQAASLS